MSAAPIKTFIALLLLCLTSQLLSAQAWEKTDWEFPSNGSHLYELANEDLVYIDDTVVHCLDKFGNYRWNLDLYGHQNWNALPRGMVVQPNGNLLVVADDINSTYHLINISPTGFILSRDTLFSTAGSITRFIPLSNGENVILNTIGTAIKVDTSGTVAWANPYQPIGAPFGFNNIIPTYDGGLLMVGSEAISTTQSIYVFKMDSNGNTEFGKSFLDTPGLASEAFAVAQLPDSSFVVYVQTDQALDTYGLLKLDQNGDSLDLIPITNGSDKVKQILPTLDNELLIHSYGHLGPLQGKLTLEKRDLMGNLSWSIAHTNPDNSIDSREAIALQDSGYAITGLFFDPQNFQGGTYVARTHPDGQPFDNLVVGEAYYDLNGNCIRESNEPAIPSLLLGLSGDANFLFSTNGDGEIRQSLSQGNYQLTVSSTNAYWTLPSCSSPVSINFPGTGDTLAVEIPVAPLVLCPDLSVDISAGFLPVCFESYYVINYENRGTDSASNAYVDVSLPPSVTFDSATVPTTLQMNGDYRCDIGTVPFAGSGSFRVYVTVDCPSNPLDLLGTTECASAKIYPDSICTPLPTLWDSSNVEVEVRCMPNDTLRFAIRNNSNAAMTTSGNYIVLEDNIMRINSPFQLAANDSIILFEAGNGSTWTLLADQSPGHPTSIQPLISVEGCGTNANGSTSLGIVSQMPQDDENPTFSIFCAEYVGAYDPNDKLAFPQGVGIDHDLEKEREIEYMVRFQNTGTFFARDVVIRDTIDNWLDLTTFRMIGASHDFEYQILPGRILRVDFPNIMLPDSSMDEPNSHGFVKFALYPDSTVALGQRINGRAGIYFDYNPPIITNQVFHTISEEMFGLVSVDEAVAENRVQVEVFPNPFQEAVWFRSEEPWGKGASLSLFNLQGVEIRRLAPSGVREFFLLREGLSQGAYIFHLEDGHGKIATGKVLIQ